MAYEALLTSVAALAYYVGPDFEMMRSSHSFPLPVGIANRILEHDGWLVYDSAAKSTASVPQMVLNTPEPITVSSTSSSRLRARDMATLGDDGGVFMFWSHDLEARLSPDPIDGDPEDYRYGKHHLGIFNKSGRFEIHFPAYRPAYALYVAQRLLITRNWSKFTEEQKPWIYF